MILTYGQDLIVRKGELLFSGPPDQPLQQSIELRQREWAGACYCDYGFHLLLHGKLSQGVLGALPVFADIDETLGLDPADFDSTFCYAVRAYDAVPNFSPLSGFVFCLKTLNDQCALLGGLQS